MYLEHFGLNEPPFKVTPVTDFFFSGANRGEILDALVYAITDGEGIVKVSGEVGSGKTMLCRMLLDRLPTNLKAIYLANPSLSRDELLYAIADRLGLDLEGQRVNVILQNLQNDLEAKYARGERCVVLVDEAHAMPLETLEELRLLYNLQVGKAQAAADCPVRTARAGRKTGAKQHAPVEGPHRPPLHHPAPVAKGHPYLPDVPHARRRIQRPRQLLPPPPKN